ASDLFFLPRRVGDARSASPTLAAANPAGPPRVRPATRKGKPTGDGRRLENGRAMSLEGSTPSPSAFPADPERRRGGGAPPPRRRSGSAVPLSRREYGDGNPGGPGSGAGRADGLDADGGPVRVGPDLDQVADLEVGQGRGLVAVPLELGLRVRRDEEQLAVLGQDGDRPGAGVHRRDRPLEAGADRRGDGRPGAGGRGRDLD